MNNNYFNSAALHTAGDEKVKFDDSGTYGTFDPGFVSSAMGDFTVKNQTVINKKIGDPRWIK